MVIAYLRVSTGKQHLENQREEIKKFADKKALSVDSWVTETVSGKRSEKDRNLGEIMRKMKSGDSLIVTEFSRLSRTLTEIMSILGYCLEKGIYLYSIKDGYTLDDSINSKVLAFAFGLVAEIEHNLISMRTKEALAVRKAQGISLGRPKGKAVKQQILVENKAQIIRLLHQGKTVTSVCRLFNVSRDTFYTFKKNHPLNV